MRMCERKLLRELNPRRQSVHLSLPGTTVLFTRSGLNLKTGSSENKQIQIKMFYRLITLSTADKDLCL